MSRMIFALVLASGLPFAGGCGSKPEPTQPSASLASEPTPPPAPASPTSPNPPTPPVPPKAETANGAWELDASKHTIPAAPVRGNIAGVEVTPEVQIMGNELNFCVLKEGMATERCVRLNLTPMLLPGEPSPTVQGRNWKIKIDAEPGPNVPMVWVEEKDKQPYLYSSGYALTLELGHRKDGVVAGKIYLCLQDEKKTTLVGTFAAKCIRLSTEPPGPEEVPYINGKITAIGAKPGAEARVGIAAFAAMGGVTFSEFTVPLDPPMAVRKDEPVPYEHVKLKPGRYLLSVALVGGPTVSKWVEVAADSKLTENFTIDATKTGGVEVSVPTGVMGKVLIAPADEPNKSALDADLFRAVCLQVMRQDIDIVSGKALIKNLAPGKYEVRAGELKGTVEIVAGKTSELALMPPKK